MKLGLLSNLGEGDDKMQHIITKFNDRTGDIQIVTPVPFTIDDLGINYMYANEPKYEDKRNYNIFDLISENEELQKEKHRLRTEVESLTEFKEEHDIMKHFIIDNKLWESFLNYNEFIRWLRK